MTHSYIKKAWDQTADALGKSQPDIDLNRICNNKTALDRLRNRYRHFCIIAINLSFLTNLLFSNNHLLISSQLRLPVSIAFSSFFLICFAMDYWLWNKIRHIDPVAMTISTVAELALLYRKRHLQFMAILIPLAIGLIGLLAYAVSDDTAFLSGMSCGAAIGLMIGLIVFRRFMNDYRDIYR